MPHLLVTAKHLSSHCQYLCKLLKKYCPQFDMDGVRNVWIVKPGAKSRGRGELLSLFFIYLLVLLIRRLDCSRYATNIPVTILQLFVIYNNNIKWMISFL